MPVTGYMNSMIFHPFFMAFLLALLCAFAGRQILHLFRIEIDNLNPYLRISLSMAVAELTAIFLLNILLMHVSYRSAGWLILALFLILAATQLSAKIRKKTLIKASFPEILPAFMLALMALPALYGLLYFTGTHIEIKYLFVSYIRNNGLPLMKKLPDNSWIIHNYHYGPELIVAMLTPLAPLYDCIGFVKLTKIPGAFHIATYVLMLHGVTSQLLPAMGRAWKCAITFFVLYYGGNTLLIYLAYSNLPPAAFVNESLVPNSILISGWCNPLIRSLLNDSLIVAFKSWEMSIQHLLVIFLPVLWVLIVNRLAADNGFGNRKGMVLLPSVLLIVMLTTAFLIHEEVGVYVIGTGLFYLFYKFSGRERRNNHFIWAALVVIFTGLFTLLQGGTISHFFYSYIAGNKPGLFSTSGHFQSQPQVPLTQGTEGGFSALPPRTAIAELRRQYPENEEGDMKDMINNPPDRRIRLNPNPAPIGYGVGRMSLITHPWRLLVHHGIDYYILIPVTAFYLLRRMKRETAGFSEVIDFWIIMAVPMAFFSLFIRIESQDFLCERFNKVELAALTILMLFFWVKEKARSAWAETNAIKNGIFYLAVALFFVSSTTRSVFYYITFPKVENVPLRKFCAEHVNKYVNDSR